MTSAKQDDAKVDYNSRKPLLMAGAGSLTSALWKCGDERSGWRYHFNVFRLANGTGKVSQLFRPSDLSDFISLTHVLAAVLVDDGCLAESERTGLRQLMAELQRFDAVPDHFSDASRARRRN